LAVVLRVAFLPAALQLAGFRSFSIRAFALTDETDLRSILAIAVADFVRYACRNVAASAEDHALAPFRTAGLFVVALRVAFLLALRID